MATTFQIFHLLKNEWRSHFILHKVTKVELTTLNMNEKVK